MSAHWGLAYLKTGADQDTVLDAVRTALRAEVDGRLYTSVRNVTLTYPPHDAAPVRDDFDRMALYARSQPAILLYPSKNGLYSIEFVYCFSPAHIMMSDRESRERTARAITDAQAAGELAGSGLVYDMAAVVFPQVMRELSRALDAEIAFVLFMRNPAVDVTAIQFYRRGEAAAEYFCRLYEGQPDRIDIPEPGAVGDLMDGRFRFVSRPQEPAEDGFVRRFSAEDFGRASVNPEYTAYTPEQSRLFVPFWIDDFKPFWIISYDLEGLFERRYVKGTAPRPVIREITPACVLRSDPDPARRALILSGEHLPVIHHGLQFRSQDTGELSIIFDMEIHWTGTARILVDMARIQHLLWPERRVKLQARIIDTENADYRAISDWSAAFVLANNERDC
jgi:hypothetical protein